MLLIQIINGGRKYILDYSLITLACIFFSSLQFNTKVENSWNDTSFPGGNIEKAGFTCTVSTCGGLCVVVGGNVGLKHSAK